MLISVGWMMFSMGNQALRFDRFAFVDRQKIPSRRLLSGRFRCPTVTPEEKMLVELVRDDTEKNSGLQSYLRDMMAVMSFDADRRGRLISAGRIE